MPENALLLFPILAGYTFLHACHLSRFRAEGLEGYRLLFESLLVGAAFGLVGRLVAFLVNLFDWGRAVSSWWLGWLPPDQLPYSGSVFLSVVLLVLVIWGMNRNLDRETSKTWLGVRYGNDLLRLFLRAIEQDDPVALTLDNRKVYVGYVKSAPVLAEKGQYLVILPVMSGYRNSEDLRVKFAVGYIRLWRKDESLKKQFETVIPIESIKAAHIFDDRISQHDFAIPAEDTSQPQHKDIESPPAPAEPTISRGDRIEYSILLVSRGTTRAQPYPTTLPQLANRIRNDVVADCEDSEIVHALRRLEEEGRIEVNKFSMRAQLELSLSVYGDDGLFFYGNEGDGSNFRLNWTHRTQPHFEQLEHSMRKAGLLNS